MLTGRITKATAGFYYVNTGADILACKPRGLFRKSKVSPYVGDLVEVALLPEEQEGTHTITKILPRRNILVRPPLANLDYLVLIVSVEDPRPNFVTLDKLLATLDCASIPTMLAITKVDLADPEPLRHIYRTAGYQTFVLDYEDSTVLSALTTVLLGNIVAFSGNTGVGKSTLLNHLDPALALEVGETSKKLGRGRHTTRHVEIHTLQNGLTIADTPGFSSMDLLQTGAITAEALAHHFIDFVPHIPNCRFRDCHHLKEIGCAVRQAVDSGEISPSRFESYHTIYNEIKDIKEWERR